MPTALDAKIVQVSSRFFMYDNTCKYLAENFPEDLSSWLIGERVALVELNPTELNVAPIRADSIILLNNLSCYLQPQRLETAARSAKSAFSDRRRRTLPH
jgi:hypothetical protein